MSARHCRSGLGRAQASAGVDVGLCWVVLFLLTTNKGHL